MLSDTPLGSWRNRRLFLLGSSLLNAVVILYILFTGKDTSINKTLVEMAFFSQMAYVGSYVFGAAWQDIVQLRQQLKDKDREDGSPPPRRTQDK